MAGIWGTERDGEKTMRSRLGFVMAFSLFSLAQSTAQQSGAALWLPPETSLLVKFPAPGDLGNDTLAFQSVLSHITRLEGLHLELPEEVRSKARSVTGAAWFKRGEMQQVLVVRGPAGLPAVAEGIAVARVPGDLMVLGSPPAVARCLASNGSNALLATLEEALDSNPGGVSSGWAWAGAEWLGAVSDQEEWPVWTFQGARSQVRSVTLRSRPQSDRIHLRMSTLTATPEAARFLASELEQHLKQARPPDNPVMQRLVDQSEVHSDTSRIELRLVLESEALAALLQSQNAIQVFTWQLSSALREQRERLPELISHLGIGPGSRVADIGTGTGFLAFRLARLVGTSGRVLAVDIEENLLEEIRSRAAREGYSQLEALLGTESDPRLPESSLDAAVIINAYHEMPEHHAMLARIHAALGPGGILLLLEPYSTETLSDPREEQVERHHIAPDLLEQEARKAGFEVVFRDDRFTRRSEPDSPQQDALLVVSRPR